MWLYHYKMKKKEDLVDEHVEDDEYFSGLVGTNNSTITRNTLVRKVR